jgi:hypothetical protein
MPGFIFYRKICLLLQTTMGILPFRAGTSICRELITGAIPDLSFLLLDCNWGCKAYKSSKQKMLKPEKTQQMNWETPPKRPGFI